MTLDPVKLVKVVHEEFGKLPHPDVPELTNSEYPLFERVAAMKRNPEEPTPEDVRDSFNELTSAGISPSQWEHAWEIARPLANRLLGRDPSLQELVRHADAHPKDIYDYYYHLPSQSHPHIKAGVFADYMHIANDFANEHLERAPLLREIAHFASAQYHPDQVDNYYQRMKENLASSSAG